MKIRRSLGKASLAILMALVISLGFVADTTRVLAIPDLDYYSGNDILFYDPDASCGTSGSGSANLVGNSNAEKIWNFLVSKGLTNEQTAGVMGNIQAESNYEPNKVEQANGVGYGIAQWSYGRRTALEAAAKKKGVDVSDMAFQLEYLYQELTSRPADRPEYKQFSSEWEMIKGQTTIEDALVAFHHEFEISHLMNEPNPRESVIRERGQAAKDAFASFSKNTPNASSSSSNCSSAATGNLSQATLAYAWPDYHSAPYVQKKPEYEAAVTKAKSEGRYVGDMCHGGGVDCGGFVTLLITTSGFDPSYNSNGKGGATDAQAAWAQKNWQTLGNGGSIDTGTLKPGDVAISGGHTFVYVGDIRGFNSPNKIASASQCERAPMAGTESLTNNEFTWYRKK
jgi:hypothetical protein